ncbi:MAG: putative oxidoreductase C-terminal domain-containing protein [Bacteroidota bacterium]|nr:putative oxidoreductase C-terminal domain-containing protein [Bacteroidota bacterium]
MTLDPGHFHAALVQKEMYPEVNTEVFVFAPDAADVGDHLNRIEGFNARADNPTSWISETYRGPDFFARMLKEKPGNVLVLAGNNEKKTEYILEAVQNGINVYSDKPMAINIQDFELLKQAYQSAEEQGVLLYDIMTERFAITSVLQKELSLMPKIFGEIEPGSPDNPSVVKESVHHFFKYVSGKKIKRPPWFFDVTQEGDGIVDVTTHLVDLIQWACYPEVIIDYKKDIEILKANRWATPLTKEEFSTVTRLDEIPEYLHKDLDENALLQVYCNGEITYQLKDIHARVKVEWKYKAPEGTGDTHYSILRGTLAELEIRQGAAEDYKPELYLIPKSSDKEYMSVLNDEFSLLETKFPGIQLEESEVGFRVSIPDKYRIGHEAHFGQVTAQFLKYLKAGELPVWEVPNSLAKYYTTTAGLELAKKQK